MRLIAGLSVTFTVMWLLLIAGIRTQPERFDGLDTLFYSDGCELPCIFGIQLGETSPGEAMQTLNAHPWVRLVIDERSPNCPQGLICWWWGDDAPPYLDPWNPNVLTIDYAGETVTEASIETDLPLGKLHRLLGSPGQNVGYHQGGRARTMTLISFFEDNQVSAMARVPCPGWQNGWWFSDVENIGLAPRIYHVDLQTEPIRVCIPGE